jgi:hypothetical protein
MIEEELELRNNIDTIVDLARLVDEEMFITNSKNKSPLKIAQYVDRTSKSAALFIELIKNFDTMKINQSMFIPNKNASESIVRAVVIMANVSYVDENKKFDYRSKEDMKHHDKSYNKKGNRIWRIA